MLSLFFRFIDARRRRHFHSADDCEFFFSIVAVPYVLLISAQLTGVCMCVRPQSVLLVDAFVYCLNVFFFLARCFGKYHNIHSVVCLFSRFFFFGTVFEIEIRLMEVPQSYIPSFRFCAHFLRLIFLCTLYALPFVFIPFPLLILLSIAKENT